MPMAVRGRKNKGRFEVITLDTKDSKKKKNPGTLQEAEDLSEKFHGRGAKEIEDVVLATKYPSNLTKLGELTELEIDVDGNGDELVPIEFEGVSLCSTTDGKQLILVGGDQSIDLEELGVSGEGKNYVDLGEVVTISYFTDKHHLTGPKQQKSGMEYEHEFGEDGGELPMAVYDCLNERILLVGGGYHVEERGIVD